MFKASIGKAWEGTGVSIMNCKNWDLWFFSNVGLHVI